MEKKKESSGGRLGKAVAVVVVVGVVVAAYLIFSGPSSAARSTRHRTFVDAETGEPFEGDLEAGMKFPIKSPDTGKMTGVIAELCYWTADGQPKAKPDAVLLNSMHMPPIDGPTFCPVCHRLVVGHNPAPTPGGKPPLTETEYKARYGDYGGGSRDR